MDTPVSESEVFQILSRYHVDIFRAVEHNNFSLAIRLLFDFSAEFCPNFEPDVAALNESIEAAGGHLSPESPGYLQILQAFHKVWIEMEDSALSGLSAEIAEQSEVNNGSVAVTSKDGLFEGDLFRLKKEIIGRSTAAARPLISLTDAKRQLGRKKNAFILGPINLDIRRGQIIGIVGKNAAGKTTLLRLISGELAPSEGTVSYGGLQAPDLPSIRRRVALLQSDLPPNKNWVLTALWATAAAHGIPPGEIERRIRTVINKFGFQSDAEKRVSELSTGFRRRFELARIILTDPDILVLDEPIDKLDLEARLSVLEDLKMLAASVEAPRAIIISSHRIELVEAISDHLISLSDGTVAFNGPKDEVQRLMKGTVFEIGITENHSEFERFLVELGAIRTRKSLIAVTAIFPEGTGQDQILRAISESKFRIEGFRDLSNRLEATMIMSGQAVKSAARDTKQMTGSD